MDKQRLNAPLYHICTNRIAHLYRMVKGASSMIDDHRNDQKNKRKLFILIFTNLILLPPVTNKHEPFHEVCVRTAQSHDSQLSVFQLKNNVDEDAWVHHSAVRIVTFHEVPIYHSTTGLCLFLFLRIDESNDIFVPIFAFFSRAESNFSLP